jgi:hypothetical protein
MESQLILIRQIFVIIAFSLSTIVGYSQYYPVDTAELNSAYRELEKKPNSVEQSEIFFDAFPSTWIEYLMTYQYVPTYSSMRMQGKNYDYTMAVKLLAKHIDMFFDIHSVIPDSIYCDKLVSLSIGGRWDADASSALQRILHKIVSIKPNVMFNRLSKQTRGFQLRFWQFYWSSLEANDNYNKECDKLKKMMKDTYPDEIKIMTTAFEYAWKEMMYPVDNFPTQNRSHTLFKVRKQSDM